ncbi:37S ribosomal protein S10, mitochondrial [Cyphellophora attinorum]|uniref:Small ribosomal subunit protein uS10m n=1 Tax=Cyphellophora attinorum TaxID=1664694 RepID=A0A0N1H6M7_9EURO|nr:37S ribosomal protein S10, mitochondrial [Phialophora attinorum]KPI41750.1 37S ribosomal protein S10, mitochondrial [Phialophora attinorum]
MSVPYAIRLAIEACRPVGIRATASSRLRPRPPVHLRPFSHDRCLRKDDDRLSHITEEFPLPKAEPFEGEQAPEDLSDAPAAAIPGGDAEAAADTEAMAAGTQPVEAAAPPPPRDPTPHTTTAPVTSASPSTEPSLSKNKKKKMKREKREKTSTSTPSEQSAPSEQLSPSERSSPPEQSSPSEQSSPEEKKPKHLFPPNVLATHLAPMRHQPTYGIPVGSLQLRSYSVRNLEFFADFCMRAAFYLKMPARGPVPLPRRTERWTMIRSNFIHKKSQENFERITYKRLITVLDADKSAVETWLAFVRKWQFYGVGMKANVWSFESVDVAKEMDATYEKSIAEPLNKQLEQFGWNEEMSKLSSVETLLKYGDKMKNTIGTPMMDVGDRYQSGNYREKFLGVVDVDEKSPLRVGYKERMAQAGR